MSESCTTKRSTIILLVDDESLVINYVTNVLTGRGYVVLPASNGREALEISRRFEGHIDLVLTDIKMPEMNGPQLLSELAVDRPDTKALLMTGDSSGVDTRMLNCEILVKPFLPAKLVSKISDVLKIPV